LILLVVWGIRQMSRSSGHSNIVQPGPGGLSAREILQVRYARGEITREQYQQMLADIEK
jgi:uncharacterized membrane protein